MDWILNMIIIIELLPHYHEYDFHYWTLTPCYCLGYDSTSRYPMFPIYLLSSYRFPTRTSDFFVCLFSFPSFFPLSLSLCHDVYTYHYYIFFLSRQWPPLDCITLMGNTTSFLFFFIPSWDLSPIPLSFPFSFLIPLFHSFYLYFTDPTISYILPLLIHIHFPFHTQSPRPSDSTLHSSFYIYSILSFHITLFHTSSTRPNWF